MRTWMPEQGQNGSRYGHRCQMKALEATDVNGRGPPLMKLHTAADISGDGRGPPLSSINMNRWSRQGTSLDAVSNRCERQGPSLDEVTYGR
jgi:hypothetical protein